MTWHKMTEIAFIDLTDEQWEELLEFKEKSGIKIYGMGDLTCPNCEYQHAHYNPIITGNWCRCPRCEHQWEAPK